MSRETKMNVLCREADRQVIRVENETGSAYLINYVIYPGISIAYMDAHIQEFSCYAQPKPGVFAINHCEEGRIECNFKNGEFLYMGKGDMSIGKRSCSEYCHTAYFPISLFPIITACPCSLKPRRPSPSWTASSKKIRPICRPCATAFAGLRISASSCRKMRP